MKRLHQTVLGKDRVERKKHQQEGQRTEPLHGEIEPLLNLLLVAFCRSGFGLG